MKIINGIFIILFLLSAILQYNDPDPLLWMAIYSFGALLSLLAALGKDNLIWHYTALIIFLSYAVYLFFSPTGVVFWFNEKNAENIAETMSAQKPWIEETREFFGLIILSSASLLNLVFRRGELGLNKKYQKKICYQ